MENDTESDPLASLAAPSCRKCGAILVIKNKKLIGINIGPNHFTPSYLIFNIEWMCPATIGFIGAFRNGHDQIITECLI